MRVSGLEKGVIFRLSRSSEAKGNVKLRFTHCTIVDHSSIVRLSFVVGFDWKKYSCFFYGGGVVCGACHKRNSCAELYQEQSEIGPSIKNTRQSTPASILAWLGRSQTSEKIGMDQ
jgi:hypothetical protein